MPVHLREGREIPMRNPFTGEVSPDLAQAYTTEDTFTVERDFRHTGEGAGIRVGAPARDGLSRGPWMALTSEEFAGLFGDEALAALDSLAARATPGRGEAVDG